MNIVFLCGCLEKGMDGIGDYVHSLAVESVSLGSHVLLISWNDSFVDSPSVSTVLSCPRSSSLMTIMRIPSRLSTWQKSNFALPVIQDFYPDLLSIQYNPYSYHRKGLPFGLAKSIKALFNGIPIHVMFHELWCDYRLPVSRISMIYGIVQRYILSKFIHRLQPVFFHTTTEFYREMLHPFGINVSVVPVSTNFEKDSYVSHDRNWLISKLGFCSSRNLCILGVFGEQQTPPCPISVKQLIDFIDCWKPGCKILLVSAGRHSQRSKKNLEHLAKLLQLDSSIIELGFLPSTSVLSFLSSVDFGISTYPVELLGKSGSLASFHFVKKDVVLVGKNIQSINTGLFWSRSNKVTKSSIQSLAHFLVSHPLFSTTM
jgi:glycosyltransferase involved in cell wall biosynthesis